MPIIHNSQLPVKEEDAEPRFDCGSEEIAYVR